MLVLADMAGEAECPWFWLNPESLEPSQKTADRPTHHAKHQAAVSGIRTVLCLGDVIVHGQFVGSGVLCWQ